MARAGQATPRENSIVQFVSQDVPQSGENACPQVGLPPGFAFQMKRTLIGDPFRKSLPKNIPVVLLNLPTTGVSS